MNKDVLTDKSNVVIDSITVDEKKEVTTINLSTKQAMPKGKVKDSRGIVYEYTENGSLQKLGKVFVNQDEEGKDRSYLIPMNHLPLNKKERHKARQGLDYLDKNRVLVKRAV